MKRGPRWCVRTQGTGNLGGWGASGGLYEPPAPPRVSGVAACGRRCSRGSASPSWTTGCGSLAIGTRPVFVSGPTRKMPPSASAMDFFQLFVPDNVLKNMVVQTNMYAKKFQERFGSDGAWAEVTLAEMKAFLGYVISTSISHCESVLSIWSGGFYSSRSLARVMSQARFEKILKYFHVVAFRSSQTTHGLYKVQPFLDSLQSGFDSAFRPSQTQVRLAPGEASPGPSSILGLAPWQRRKSGSRGGRGHPPLPASTLRSLQGSPCYSPIPLTLCSNISRPQTSPNSAFRSEMPFPPPLSSPSFLSVSDSFIPSYVCSSQRELPCPALRVCARPVLVGEALQVAEGRSLGLQPLWAARRVCCAGSVWPTRRACAPRPEA